MPYWVVNIELIFLIVAVIMQICQADLIHSWCTGDEGYFSIIFHLCLCLPSGLKVPNFLSQIVYAFLISSVLDTCSTCPILLDLITLVLNEYHELWSPSLCSFLQLPIISAFLGPDIFSCCVLRHTQMCILLKSERQSFSHKTADKIIIIAHIWINIFIDRRQRILNRMGSKCSRMSLCIT
jgi:hypothetical protein